MPSTNTKKIGAPKKGEAFVRMYRQGLGDCFLLTFRGDNGKPVHVLVDCGVWDNDAATLAQMGKVVENIVAATGGHLDLLVCTHEHWDHNSGFLQHRELFEGMTIDHVWLAWTENPDEPLAVELKGEFAARRNKLALAMDRLRDANPTLAASVESLAGFHAALNAATGNVPAEPDKAMQWVRERGKHGAKVEFCSPGDVRPIPRATSAARALVLGPPKSRKQLRKNLATKKETDAGDVYHLGVVNPLADQAFFAAAQHVGKSADEFARLSTDECEAYESSVPFDSVYQLTPEQAKADALIGAAYADAASAWRRIDNDWLNTAAQIALWMDSSTNNTSLVLAFELLPSQKVLLFAADAQVGNWMSWRDVSFAAPAAGVRVDDLLGRTVLYKVGHHGSHNATLRKDGLEQMTHQELVAMIPVNAASVKKKGWKMPFAPMYQALRAKTSGRVIRADDGVQSRPSAVNSSTWRAFTERCEEDSVYVRLTVR